MGFICLFHLFPAFWPTEGAIHQVVSVCPIVKANYQGVKLLFQRRGSYAIFILFIAVLLFLPILCFTFHIHSLPPETCSKYSEPNCLKGVWHVIALMYVHIFIHCYTELGLHVASGVAAQGHADT